MVKRILLLTITLASLAGLILWWPRGEIEDTAAVKGQRLQVQSSQTHLSINNELFVSDKTGELKIYLFDDNQNKSSILIDEPGSQFLPSLVGQDGLLFFSYSDGFYQLWRYDLNQSQKEFIIGLRQEPVDLFTTADGRWAIYSVTDAIDFDYTRRSFLIDLKTKRAQTITDGVRSILISSNNRSLIINKKDGLYYSEISTTGQATELLKIIEGKIYAPALSSDGESLYYIVEADGTYKIVVNNLRGSSVEDVLILPDYQSIIDWTLKISPDNNELLYTAVESHEALTGIIGRLKIDGTDWQELTDDGVLADWSNSSEYIWYNKIVVSEGKKSIQLWRMNRQGNYREAIMRSAQSWFMTPNIS